MNSPNPAPAEARVTLGTVRQTVLDCTVPCSLQHAIACANAISEAEAELESLRAKVARLQNENEGLLELTSGLEEHPEDYDGPCMCKLCISYGSDDGDGPND